MPHLGIPPKSFLFVGIFSDHGARFAGDQDVVSAGNMRVVRILRLTRVIRVVRIVKIVRFIRPLVKIGCLLYTSPSPRDA